MVYGTIALDIDGTITAEKHALSAGVAAYLGTLSQLGWRIVFITGRPFSWAYPMLQPLDFPYHLAVQNGAIILEMPSRTVVAKKYLDNAIFSKMDEVCRKEASDFVIYGGFEYDDICYFRPSRFSKELLQYVQQRTAALGEHWVSVDSYAEIGLSGFPSVKCFGDQVSAERISENIKLALGLNAPPIRDPFNESFFVVQATHPQVCKGQALGDLARQVGGLGRLIAAGDDLNDRTMLAMADVKVVMATAPAALLQMADIIAPPASEEGIISGLQKALMKLY